MSYKKIPGLNLPPTRENDNPRWPIIGQPQLQMLETCGINSFETLKHYIDQAKDVIKKDVSRIASDGKFRVIKAEELGFDEDSEHRLYWNNIVARDTILDLSVLRIRDSSTLDLTNCIIVGDLEISMNSQTLRKVYLDRCFVLGSIIIYGIHSPDCDLYIGDTNCFTLEVSNSVFKTLQISTCKLPMLYLNELALGELSVHMSKIEYSRLKRIDAKKTLIDHKQFDLRKTAASEPRIMIYFICQTAFLKYSTSRFMTLIEKISIKP